MRPLFIAAVLLAVAAGASAADKYAGAFDMGWDQAREMIDGLIAACKTLAELPVPVVALVHGPCLGGAMELVAFCDFVVADPGATFGQPEIALGVIPGAGGTQRLTRAIGKAFSTMAPSAPRPGRFSRPSKRGCAGWNGSQSNSWVGRLASCSRKAGTSWATT